MSSNLKNKNFEKAFKHVVSVEGGYSNHPMDKGGPTKYGITLARLRSFCGNPHLTKEDVKSLTLWDVAPIYKKDYWDAWNLDDVERYNIQLVLFDQCVNWGVGKSTVRRVQKSLSDCGMKFGRIDGVLGPRTVHALNSVNEDMFLMDFLDESQDAYIRLVKRKPKYLVFIEGWINRTQELFKTVFGTNG